MRDGRENAELSVVFRRQDFGGQSSVTLQEVILQEPTAPEEC